MKIGLVPLLYDECNYGGVLQFFALQKILKNNGFECEIIHFTNNEKVLESNTFILNRVIIIIKKFIYNFLHFKDKNILNNALKERQKEINLFKNKYFSTTVESNDIDYSDYKAIICGSDQIWNPNWAKRRCFLEFVPDETNKIIYAASLGVENINENEGNIFRPRIMRLQHVSVREYSAKQILQPFVPEKKINVVLDPTLLLLEDEWKEFCQDTLEIKEKFLFTYFLGDYSTVKNYVEQFAYDKKLKIVNIPFASGEKIDNENWGDIKILGAGPEKFLGLIKNAEYIFTDSFHACVFSVIFQKEFYVFERDQQKGMSGRIYTLIKNFDLPNRIISRNVIKELPRIDYSKTVYNQKKLIEQSLKFLLGSIND